jgi:hypothetical protein
MVIEGEKLKQRPEATGSKNCSVIVQFSTVANSKTEAGLTEDEKAHVCDSSFLVGRGHFGRTEAMRLPAPTLPAQSSRV